MKCLRNNKSRIGSLPLIILIIITFIIFFTTLFFYQSFIKIKNEKEQLTCSHYWVFIPVNNDITKIKCKKCGINYYKYKEEQLND